MISRFLWAGYRAWKLLWNNKNDPCEEFSTVRDILLHHVINREDLTATQRKANAVWGPSAGHRCVVSELDQ